MKHNIIKVASVTPKLHVCNPLENAKEILKVLKKTEAELVVFPELSLTGYTCGDYFYQKTLIDDTLTALKELLEFNFSGIFAVGMPLEVDDVLYNVAVVIQGSKILGIVPKYYNPNTGEFGEKRYFNSALGINFNTVTLLGEKIPFGQILFSDKEAGIKFAVEVCQDMWVPIPPSSLLSLVGANMVLNLSASNEYIGKDKLRRNIVKEHSRKNAGVYIYTSSGATESTSETVFSGHNIHSIVGNIVNEAKHYSLETEILYSDIDFGYVNTYRKKDASLKDSLHKFDIKYQEVEVLFKKKENFKFSNPLKKDPFLPEDTKENFNEIRNIQHFGLLKRLEHLGKPKSILGISGGLDSSYTLVLLVDLYKRFNLNIRDIIAISMPGPATSAKTRNNAKKLSEALGVTFKEIDINEEVNLHFKMIEQNKDDKDVTYENTQARIRTQTLMNLANKENGIVIGTGSLSEIALGFMTYNADMNSMYAVNGGMPKTLVQRQFKNYTELFPEIKDLITDILNTPISPELKDNQETEKLLGSYIENDFLIYRHLVCGDSKEKLSFMMQHTFEITEKAANEAVSRFIKRFYNNQFKRQVMPDGPKILMMNLSPRSDYKLNSDVKIK